MNKTNYIVFRNGGIKRNKKLCYKGECIKPTSYYKYSGVMILTHLSWALALQADKIYLHCVGKLNKECDFSFNTQQEIFDGCTIPVITWQ